jgi:hypothetical protein
LPLQRLEELIATALARPCEEAVDSRSARRREL